ncbi:hypothetical protein GBAR_LOCUS1560 [Geodia barretti]|uniref:Uncharacterized protein n=1 Tax=Geodia barretti TaxID=519541 RepID=A0AA35QWI7_GEOBA|nr:hypothetical protein GBAR_LOCUS1560 [Geodia barretti]
MSAEKLDDIQIKCFSQSDQHNCVGGERTGIVLWVSCYLCLLLCGYLWVM